MKYSKRICSLLMAGTMAFGFAACESSSTGSETTRYKVQFKDYDGSTIGAEQSIAEGNAAYAPLINPSREGWKFVGWDKEFKEVTQDLVVTARYEAIEYEVKFIGDDGEQIGETQLITYENDAVAPQAPDVEGKTFVGWKGDYTDVTKDVEIYAVYETELPAVMHAVTFVGADGEFLGMQSVANGLTASAPEINTYKKNYYFSGWSADLTNITEDKVVKAVFDTAENVEGLKLYKTQGEDFDILNLSDIQIINMETSAAAGLTDASYEVYRNMDEAVFDTVKYLIEKTTPDYIVLTGDNIYSKFEFEDLRTWKMLFDVVDGYDIPWSMCFGNHDGSIPAETADNNVTLERIIALAEEYEYFLYESNADLFGEEGTYAVNIVEKGTEKLVQKVFYLYAHYNQGWYSEEQLAWYEDEAKALVAGDEVVPSLLYTHYPLPEMERSAYAYDYVTTTTDSVEKFAGVKVPETDQTAFGELNSCGFMSEYGLFRLIKKYGTTQNVFSGHEHSNNMSSVYEGVRLTYGLKTGYYDQSSDYRYLNGGTVFSIGDDNRDYSMYHIFHKGVNDGKEQGVYDQVFNLTPAVDTRTYMEFDSVGEGSSHYFANSKAVTLEAGESASIVVDVAQAPDSASNMQQGFYVSPSAITAAWPYTGSASYLYFMADGKHCYKSADTMNYVTDVEEVIPKAFSRGSTQGNYTANCHPKNVFATGNSVRLTVNYDGSYVMQVKRTGEADTAYQTFITGTVAAFDPANVYLGFVSTTDMKLYGVSITDTAYITGYNTVGMNFIPEGATPMTIAPDGQTTYCYVYGKDGIQLGGTDELSLEFELVAAPSGLSSAAMFGITVTSTPKAAWAYTGAGSFYVGSNNVYTAHGGGDGVVQTSMEMVQNSYFEIPENATHDIAWSGTQLFKGFMAYKYTFSGDGTIKLYAKSTLKTGAEYELIAQGKATGMDTTKTYYISLLAANEYKLNKLVINGKSDVSEFGLTYAVVS